MMHNTAPAHDTPNGQVAHPAPNAPPDNRITTTATTPSHPDTPQRDRDDTNGISPVIHQNGSSPIDRPTTPPPAVNNKKRKLADLQSRTRSPSASRPPSPPWKKFGAEGPTAFVEDGKRRSGRVNAVPLALQPPSGKRQTRRAHEESIQAKVLKKENTLRPNKNLTPSQPAAAKKDTRPTTAAVSKPTTNGARDTALPPVKVTKSSPKTNGVKHEKDALNAQPATSHDDIIPAADNAHGAHPSPARRRAGRPRRSTQPVQNGVPKEEPQDTIKSPATARKTPLDRPPQSSPRITLKLRRPSFSPKHPSHIPKVSGFASLEDILSRYDQKEKELATAPKDDDRYEGLERRPAERAEQTPDQLAWKEAHTRLKLLDAAKPGGLLSEEKSSLYLPDEQPHPPTQYGHHNHLWAQGAYFKLLLDREKRGHVEVAKKVAHACLAKWKEKQPQTEEEKEREENVFFRLIYRQTVRDVKRKWELVEEEIKKRQLVRWEEQEQIERERKMQRMLEKSTTLLDKRRARLESDRSLEGDDDMSHGDSDTGSDESDDDADNDDHVMSSSESEDGVDEADPDATLSPEALRRKYETLPELDLEPSDNEGDDMDVDGEGNLGDADDDDHSTTDQTPRIELPAEDSSVEDLDPADAARYAEIGVEEVDGALLDDSDESTNMSDEDMSSDDDEEGDGDDDDEQDESEEEDIGMLGFLGGRERRTLQEVEEEPPEDADDTIIPPTSGEQAEPPEILAAAEESDLSRGFPHPRLLSPDRNADSHGEDRSSQLSPKDDTTAEPTDAESTTSVDLDDAEDIVRSTENTPQPIKAPMTKIPSLLRGTLREYQHHGLDWLAKLYANQTNGILADEMGLGKTIQTIALLAHLAEEHHVWGPHLIVVPTSVILNWEMEFKKFLPGFKVLSYYGTVEERAQKRKGWANPDNWNVVITSYQLILKDLSAIRVPEWHYMILDEAHNIKNFNSQRYQAMIRLKTHARLLLTGTPLQNSIIELWSLLTFLTAGQDGQGMGNLEEFTEWFRRPVDEIFVDGKSRLGNEAQEIVNKLHHSLRPYLLRRLKSTVEKQLPGKYEHTVICRLSKRQRQLYDAFMGLSDTKAKLISGNMISVSQALMSLRKVCNHPDLFEERPIVTSFAMPKPYSKMPQAVVANYEIKDLLIRRRLLAEDPSEQLDLNFLSLNLTSREGQSRYYVRRTRQLKACEQLYQLVRKEAQALSSDSTYDGSSFESIASFKNRLGTLEKLNRIQRYSYLTEQRTKFDPVFGTDLIERCTIHATDSLYRQPPPHRSSQSIWYQNTSSLLHSMVKTVQQRADIMNPLVCKFSCITPNTVATDILPFMVPRKTIITIQSAANSLEPDPFHEARIRLSIAFPDKRLLQYDCGKLQRLATLLRDLQSRGSRALIFTQMTSVLDILERFLNIYGYRYLRLDGSTRIESRQDMMERFNRDTRIDVFILSSRSGGVGMNLTGADTVIFYDLDWNPQMDKQCQDRAHRIGQTRDVHIYKFVSEHTIEVNILRKSNQKRLLDEVVIQEGEFTTDYFNAPEDSSASDGLVSDDFAGAAVDRLIGANTNNNDISKVLEAVEDAEDVAAAKATQKDLQADDFDFERPGGGGNDTNRNTTARITPKTSVPPTPVETMAPLTTLDADGTQISTTLDAVTAGFSSVVDANADDTQIADKGNGVIAAITHVDEFMLKLVEWEKPFEKFVPPADRSRRGRLDKNGRDRSHRPRKR